MIPFEIVGGAVTSVMPCVRHLALVLAVRGVEIVVSERVVLGVGATGIVDVLLSLSLAARVVLGQSVHGIDRDGEGRVIPRHFGLGSELVAGRATLFRGASDAHRTHHTHQQQEPNARYRDDGDSVASAGAADGSPTVSQSGRRVLLWQIGVMRRELRVSGNRLENLRHRRIVGRPSWTQRRFLLGMNDSECLYVLVAGESTAQLGARELEDPIEIVSGLAIGVHYQAYKLLIIVRCIGTGQNDTIAINACRYRDELAKRVSRQPEALVIGIQARIDTHSAGVQPRRRARCHLSVREHPDAKTEISVLPGHETGPVDGYAGTRRWQNSHVRLHGRGSERSGRAALAQYRRVETEVSSAWSRETAGIRVADAAQESLHVRAVVAVYADFGEIRVREKLSARLKELHWRHVDTLLAASKTRQNVRFLVATNQDR